MNLFKDFVSSYGAALLYAVITAIAGYLGVVIKNIYEKWINDKTKKEVVKTCVHAVEQIYKDLHGEEKYNKVVEAASEILAEKGITISEFEIRMLIEAAVAEFNKVFEST